MEIDENLCRAELTAAQRAIAIGRRKEIWEALHPETARIPRSLGGRGNIGFSEDTERATGESKRRLQEHISRAESLGPDIKEIIGTSLDKGVELDALKKLPPEERKELIDRAKGGEHLARRKDVWEKIEAGKKPTGANRASRNDVVQMICVGFSTYVAELHYQLSLVRLDNSRLNKG
jgi:hypothetical protein